MKGFRMVNMVASEGIGLASVIVSEDTVLYEDGSGAEVPFFWVMGPGFGFRLVSEGVCPNCGSPEWSGVFFARTVNGPGSEFVELDSVTHETHEGASAAMVATAFALQYVEVMAQAESTLALARLLGLAEGVELPSAGLVEWVCEVAPELVAYSWPDMIAYKARLEAERFGSLRLDESV